MAIQNFSPLQLNSTLTVGVNDTGHDVRFYGATSGRYMEWDESADKLLFRDLVRADFGSGSDLQIQHNGSNSFISNATGNLTIQNATDDGDVIFQCDDGSGGETAYITLDGSEVKTIVSKTMEFQDNVKLAIGNSEDMTIDHNATDTRIINYTGNLRIVNGADDKDITFESDDGSGGVETYFFLDGSAGGGAPITKFPDGARLQFGSGGDSTMTHDGSNFTISTVTGDFRIKCDTDDGDVKLQCDDGSGGVADYLVLDGGDKTLIASVPLVLEADSTVGWHGSVTRVKILPRDFAGDTSGRPLMINAAVNGDRYLSSNASASMFASIPIPTGFKATHVKIHGSDTGNNFTVFEANIANKDVTTVGSATAIETEKAITNVDSSTTNYIMVEVGSNGTTDEIHGGYMTIAKI